MLAQTIARAKVDRHHVLRVRTLDFWADWSAADELMEIVADLSAAPFVPELILASGKPVYARAAVAALFASHGLKAEDHIVENQPSRSQASAGFQVRIDRLESLARRPSKTVFEVVNEMIEALPYRPERGWSRRPCRQGREGVVRPARIRAVATYHFSIQGRRSSSCVQALRGWQCSCQ